MRGSETDLRNRVRARGDCRRREPDCPREPNTSVEGNFGVRCLNWEPYAAAVVGTCPVRAFPQLQPQFGFPTIFSSLSVAFFCPFTPFFSRLDRP